MIVMVNLKCLYSVLQEAPYRRSDDFTDESQNMDLQPQPPLRASNPPPGTQRGQNNNFYNRSPSPNLAETFPPSPASKPRPAPRPPRMQPMPPKPQPRRTPSPNRPGSGGNARDQLLGPQAGDQANKDANRPDSAGRPPGLWQLYLTYIPL